MTTHKGESMPLDPVPTLDGNLVRDGREGFKVRPFDPLFDKGKRRYKSHFVSCPEADSHRRVKMPAKVRCGR